MIEGEGKVNKEFIPNVLWRVLLLDDVVDVLNEVIRSLKILLVRRNSTYSHSCADKQCKDEGKNVVTAGPEVDVDSVENAKEGEVPRDAINDDALARWEPLVDNSTQKQQVNQGPVETAVRAEIRGATGQVPTR